MSPPITVKRLGGNCVQVDGPVRETRRTLKCPTHSRHRRPFRADMCTNETKEAALETLKIQAVKPDHGCAVTLARIRRDQARINLKGDESQRRLERM